MPGIEEEYVEKHIKSKELYKRALKTFARGVTHDARYFLPFPIYCTRAKGSRKWDVDGNEYVDFWMAHGALLLGHLHPVVTEAVLEQAKKGTHYGASQELEIQWAEKIQNLIPSAKDGLVEFTSSGTEATLMALRIARAYTGRTKIIKFAGHFHGWHDYVIIGVKTPFDSSSRYGIPSGTASTVSILPPNNIGAIEEEIESGDVAGVILEPGGGSMGVIPSSREFLQDLRKITEENGVVLIFDEVVTGFRDAPGGTQEYWKVTPDLSTLGKIVGGGYPGGAVTGKREMMELLSFKDPQKKIPHPGTYNANPQCAAAGNACLGVIMKEKNEIYPYLSSLGSELKKGWQDAIEDVGVKGVTIGETSIILMVLGAEPEDLKPSNFEETKRLRNLWDGEAHKVLVKATLNKGFHLMGPRAIISIAHSREEIQQAIEGVESSLKEMKAEGLLKKFE